MPEIPDTVKDRHGWLEMQAVDQHGHGLTQWEIDFVESLTTQLLAGRYLSEKQRARLDQIQEDRLR